MWATWVRITFKCVFIEWKWIFSFHQFYLRWPLCRCCYCFLLVKIDCTHTLPKSAGFIGSSKINPPWHIGMAHTHTIYAPYHWVDCSNEFFSINRRPGDVEVIYKFLHFKHPLLFPGKRTICIFLFQLFRFYQFEKIFRTIPCYTMACVCERVCDKSPLGNVISDDYHEKYFIFRFST